jgi:predicted transcriptional regulator of viral defense system
MESRTSTRERLASLARAGALITVDTAADALREERGRAAKALARWTEQGWLKRIRRGLYTVVPLAVSPDAHVVEDAWQLVPELFNGGYVGGATAAHYWDLTEQLFRSVFVYTTAPVRQRDVVVQGATFVVRHLPQRLFFGTRPVWRDSVRVEVSDIHRTIIDMLDDPGSGGGIRQVADCLGAYLKRKDADLDKLVEYAQRIGNGAVFKRLGFLVERASGPESLISACQERLTAGLSKLDPSVPSPRVLRRWRLFLPEAWTARGRSEPADPSRQIYDRAG